MCIYIALTYARSRAFDTPPHISQPSSDEEQAMLSRGFWGEDALDVVAAPYDAKPSARG